MLKINSVRHEVAGPPLFKDLSFSLVNKRYALVGPNGVGKTTLAKILAGHLVPTAGSVEGGGALYLPQSESPAAITLAEYLQEVWESSRASEIASLISGLDFSRRLPELSGGEWMKARLAKALSQAPGFLILDEPSNNLDRGGKAALLEFIRNYSSGLLLISHDRELLAEVEVVLELSNQGVSVYGGNFEFYSEARKAERERHGQHLSAQKKAVKKLQREKTEKLATQEKRMRNAAAKAADSGIPKILLGARKRRAQVSRGRVVQDESERVYEASQKATELWGQAKSDPFLRLNFEGAQVPAGRILVSAERIQWKFRDQAEALWPKPLSFQIRGPQRWQFLGPNGSGKSTLIKLILKNLTEEQGELSGSLTTPTLPIAYLDQNYQILKRGESVLGNIQSSTRFDEVELRNELAFYGFRGEQVFQKIESLSGGEMLKAALAKIFLGSQIPELIVLDEPTNNLDLGSLALLESALRNFRGALILVCHDSRFVESLEITNTVNLDGGLE